jgi:hypothetical protein
MYRQFAQAGLLLLAISAVPSALAQSDPSTMPANLNVPPQHVRHVSAYALGSQIYVCTAQPDNPYSFGWTFKEPVAELINERGEEVGTHYAGPTWAWHDGSTVVGRVVERADAPTAGAIPWLLLRATSGQGDGQLTRVTHVQRIETVEGSAPLNGCDQSTADTEVAVPYAATYVFYVSREDPS